MLTAHLPFGIAGMSLATVNYGPHSSIASLVRLPNGTDDEDADSDWRFTSTPTPGAANVP